MRLLGILHLMNSISAYNVSGDDSRLVDSIVCVINYESDWRREKM